MMYKTLFVLLVALTVTGCQFGSTSNLTLEGYSALDTNLGTVQDSQETSTQVNTEPMQRTLPIHEDLAAQYTKAVIKTNKGDITVEFFGEKSPVTVNNFMNLAKDGFYNGTSFHRVIKDFMIQGGDPNSKSEDRMTHGTGGPEYRFDDEINDEKIVRGSLAMANAGPGTNGSQFFIVTAPETPWLDGKHTNFGMVTAGMNVVDAIEGVSTDGRDNPHEPIVIESIDLQ